MLKSRSQSENYQSNICGFIPIIFFTTSIIKLVFGITLRIIHLLHHYLMLVLINYLKTRGWLVVFVNAIVGQSRLRLHH